MTGQRRRRDGSTAVVAKRRTDTPIETGEIRALCEAAGVEVVGERTQARPRDPTYDHGDGAVVDVADLVDRRDADLVVDDDHLDPGRAHNLQAAVGAEVVDRPRLVLWVPPEHRDDGHAVPALELALEGLFRTYDAHTVGAEVLEGDDVAREAFEAVGFTEEGRGREVRFVDGEYRDAVQYGLLREAYDERARSGDA